MLNYILSVVSIIYRLFGIISIAIFYARTCHKFLLKETRAKNQRNYLVTLKLSFRSDRHRTARRIDQLITYYSFNTLPIAPPYHFCIVETLFFRLLQRVGMVCNLLRCYISILPWYVCTRLHGNFSGPANFSGPGIFWT